MQLAPHLSLFHSLEPGDTNLDRLAPEYRLLPPPGSLACDLSLSSFISTHPHPTPADFRRCAEIKDNNVCTHLSLSGIALSPRPSSLGCYIMASLGGSQTAGMPDPSRRSPWGCNNSTIGRALALHMAIPDSMLASHMVPPSTPMSDS